MLATTLTAGYGESIITPPLGLELSGYGFYLERRALSVLDDLKARALFLRSDDQAVALVICDLIGFTVPHSDEIRRAIAVRLGIPFTSVVLACTHTHTGPATLPLRGVGEVDPEYVANVGALVQQAAVNAAADCQPATLWHAMTHIEPIGYNRRNRTFCPIDAVLKVAVLQRSGGDIALTNYACHAVTLGRAAAVSADWPGGVVRAFERRGYHALATQGFCGDINPVVFLDRWGSGTSQDLDYYGEHICQRALKSEVIATREERPAIHASETRIALPIQVPPTRQDLVTAREAFLRESSNEGATRMIDGWFQEASERYDALRAQPYVADAPVQAVGIGSLRFIGLPGEVFSEYGTDLRARWRSLVTLGYAGGCIDYLPTREAYSCPGDYACYQAPRFFHVFPFTEDVEDVVYAASESLLREIDVHMAGEPV